MNKTELLNCFKALPRQERTACIDCSDCLLCQFLERKTEGYWLLNEEVTEEAYNEAKKALTV